MRRAAFLYGNDLHHLDHIVTLSLFLSLPLLVTEEEVKSVIETYYPPLEVKLLSKVNFAEEILSNYDLLFSTLPRRMLDLFFFFEEHKQRKKLLFYWLPHGNSDKDNLGGLFEDNLLLVYGKQMKDALKKKTYVTTIGNLRRHFYSLHKPFFDKKIAPLLYFKTPQTTLLYAPSWDTPDLETSFSFLLENLPPHYNLIVKPHPNTLQSGFFTALKERYQRAPNIAFVENLPLIYPLLAKTDIYIGDNSSIAYDFLSFQKPLFFLTQKRSLIHQAGKMVTRETLFPSLTEKDIFFEARASLDQYAFDPKVDYATLKTQIYKMASDFLENEIHLL